MNIMTAVHPEERSARFSPSRSKRTCDVEMIPKSSTLAEVAQGRLRSHGISRRDLRENPGSPHRVTFRRFKSIRRFAAFHEREGPSHPEIVSKIGISHETILGDFGWSSRLEHLSIVDDVHAITDA